MARNQSCAATAGPNPGPHPALTQRRLVETAQFAAVERVAFQLEQSDRFDPDPQMLADRALVKGIGLAGQLELTVERLVGHAQQGPVRDAEAVALGSNCG